MRSPKGPGDQEERALGFLSPSAQQLHLHQFYALGFCISSLSKKFWGSKKVFEKSYLVKISGDQYPGPKDLPSSVSITPPWPSMTPSAGHKLDQSPGPATGGSGLWDFRGSSLSFSSCFLVLRWRGSRNIGKAWARRSHSWKISLW